MIYDAIRKRTYIYYMSTFTYRIIDVHSLDRPLPSIRLSTFIVWTVHFSHKPFNIRDLPLYPWTSTFRMTVHFLEDRPLSVKWPSTLTRDRPLSDGLSTFDGPFTFDGPSTLPLLDRPLSPRLIKINIAHKVPQSARRAHYFIWSNKSWLCYVMCYVQNFFSLLCYVMCYA